MGIVFNINPITIKAIVKIGIFVSINIMIPTVVKANKVMFSFSIILERIFSK